MEGLKNDYRRHGMICVFFILKINSSLKSSLEKNEYKKTASMQGFDKDG